MEPAENRTSSRIDGLRGRLIKLKTTIKLNPWESALCYTLLVFVMTFFAPNANVAYGKIGGFIEKFQTLITGFGAIFAAFVTVRQMRKSDEAQDKRHRDNLNVATMDKRLQIERLTTRFVECLNDSVKSYNALMRAKNKTFNNHLTAAIHMDSLKSKFEKFNSIMDEYAEDAIWCFINQELENELESLRFMSQSLFSGIDIDIGKMMGSLQPPTTTPWLDPYVMDTLKDIIDDVKYIIPMLNKPQKELSFII